MRIISGSARGRKLAEFSTFSIRPTSDRVREALFSILNSKMGNLAEKSVLDLFAGSGAMGLEALSRGARSALFVDQAKESIELVKKNARATHLLEKSKVVQADARRYISSQTQAFDLIFIDPPYGKQDITEILTLLAENNLLRPDGLICIETAPTEPLPDTVLTLVQFDRRQYGSTAISLYQHGDLL